jgi:hypothetical protein
VEFDASEWRIAPVQKVVDAVENAAAEGWPGGEEGWRATVLEHGGERTAAGWTWWRVPCWCGRAGAHVRWRVSRAGAHARRCRRDSGAVNEEGMDDTSKYGWGERIQKWRVGPLESGPITIVKSMSKLYHFSGALRA